MKANEGYVRIRERDEHGVLSLESMLVGWNEFLKLYNAGLIIKLGHWYILDRGDK